MCLYVCVCVRVCVCVCVFEIVLGSKGVVLHVKNYHKVLMRIGVVKHAQVFSACQFRDK